MQLGSGLEGFAEKPVPALHAERFTSGLAPAQWVIRQRGLRRSHLLVIESRRGTVALRGTDVAFEAPALLWLPADLEGDLQVEAGAQGYLIAISEDFLTKTVAGSAEALHLRRTIDRLVLLKADQVVDAFDAVVHCCDTLVRELRSPGRGTATMMSSHVLLLCLHLWRSVISGEASDEAAHGSDGTRLVGNFLQQVELHYRDGWTVARYAAALGVTEDKLHAHCKREKGVSPRAIVHVRLIEKPARGCSSLTCPSSRSVTVLDFGIPAISAGSFASTKAFRRASTGVVRDWSRCGGGHPTPLGRNRA